jgi:tryptophan 2,3-dioxygenase
MSVEDEGRPINAYADYLKLSQILNAQERRSVAKGEPVHDETLFIVIHQTIELWFYQVTEELISARRAIREKRLGDAGDDLVRVARIFAVLTLSWDVLSTLRPRDFWNFRRHFLADNASGLQSRNFRAVEFLLGVGPRSGFDRPNQEADERSLWDEVIHFLSGERVDVPDEILRRNCSQAYPHSREDADGNIHGEPAIEEKWLAVYSDPAEHRELYHLGERLLDVAGALAVWRFKHIATVQRYIGDLPGSGKTSGVRYLRQTLPKRAFPELWSVRNRFEKWIEGSKAGGA